MPASYCQLCGKRITPQVSSAPDVSSGKRAPGGQRSFRQPGGHLLRHPRWRIDQQLRVCNQCYQQKPRCRECGMPMAGSLPGNLCPTCASTDQAKSKSFCRACGRVFSKRTGIIEIEGVGRYCKNCYDSRPPCDVCSGPLTDELWQLSDGLVTCAHCHATAIYTPDEAMELYDQMKSTIAQHLRLTLNIPTGMALVDRKQLAEVIQQQWDGKSEALDPQRTLGIYARRGLRRGIYVQSGLPRALLLQVAAHEYAHAWQGENCPLLTEPLVREGFAEWVAYTLLGFHQQIQQQKRMVNRNDVYGEGLRWALQLTAQRGLNGLIEACRTSHSNSHMQ